MIEYNIEEKRIIVSILIAIMEADGVIDPHETDFLDTILLSLGMSELGLDSIDELDFNMVIAEFKKFSNPKKEQAKKWFMGMAECDGCSDPRELEIINRLGQ